MSTPSVLLIRADASTAIGTGHVMRCIALAQAWQDAGGQAIFAMTASTPALQTRLEAEGMNIAHLSAKWGSADDARQTTALAQQRGARWVVADGYHFGAAYQQHIKAAGLKLLLVDDYGHADHYSADIVLNQNISADVALYARREPYTRLLLGTRYVLLRREFWPWRNWQREVVPVARKVLVTLGGSDPDNVTLLVMHALQQLATKDLDVVVLAAGSNPHYSTLQEAAYTASYAVQLRQNVHDMPDLLAWADLCIGAAGSTSWERCLIGLPSLLVVLADNQQPIAEHLQAHGSAINLGRTGSVSEAEISHAIAQLAPDADTRTEMIRRGQALVDGCGAKRVAMRMRCHSLKLRPVRQDDCRLIWEWANDPAVRAASFSSEFIPWDRHVHWFNALLSNPQAIMYIVVDEQAHALGQVRFHLEEQDATLSISLTPAARGYGCGPDALRLSTQQVFALTLVQRVHAYVKQENEASFRAFLRAGFTVQESTTNEHHTAHHFVLTRSHEEAYNHS